MKWLCSGAESATGIREGGRTGLTAIMVAFWMFVALWFTPIIGAPLYLFASQARRATRGEIG